MAQTDSSETMTHMAKPRHRPSIPPIRDSCGVAADELTAQPLAYRPPRSTAAAATFVPDHGVWRPFTFDRDGERSTERVLVVWSAGKEHLEQTKRKTYLKR